MSDLQPTQMPWIPPGSGPRSTAPKIGYTPEYGGRFYDLNAFTPDPGVPDYQQSWTSWRQNESNGEQTYWEDPMRVARWNNIIQSQPQSWQAPEFVNKEAIKTLYNYYQTTQGTDWSQWKPMGGNDAMSSIVRTMAQPPAEFMTDYENEVFTALEQQAEEARIKTPEELTQEYYQRMGYTPVEWEQLPTWQKWTMSLISPQTEVEGRPDATRLSASVFSSGLGALGVFGLGSMVGGPVLGAILAGVVLGEGIYRNYTGNYTPGISDLMQVFNLPAEGLERTVGLFNQVQADGIDQIMNDLPAAWAAAQLQYETGKMDLFNRLSQLSGGPTADANQVWRFSEGYTTPMPILNQSRTGIGPRSTAALAEARERIADGEDAAIVYADFLDRFGDTGTFNDFLLQSVLDPLNLLPYLTGRVGEKISRTAGNERLAQSFKVNTGSPLVDVLPMGLQQLVEWATGLKSSSGIISTLNTYGDWVKLGYWPDVALPKNAEGVKYVPKVDELTWFDRTLGGLDKEGRIKDFNPTTATGVKKVTQWMKSLTPDSAAGLFLSNASDNLATLLLLSDDPNLTNMERAQLATKLIRQAAGVDMVEVGQAGEAILNSPMTVSTAAALRDFVRSGVMDNFTAQWTADQPRIAMLENMARILDVNVSRLVEDIKNDPQAVLESLVQASRNNSDPTASAIIQDYEAGNLTPQSFSDQFAIFTGDNPTGVHAWDFNDWRARLVNAAFDSSMDYVTKHFGVTQNRTLNRFAELLKSAQSMMLLDLNPGYLVNNVLNNWVTRAAQGVFGFMTKRQIDGWMERFGAMPARMDTGYGGAELVDTSSAARSEAGEGYRRRTQQLRDITLGDDALAKMIKTVNKARNKIGVASKLSSAVEQNESAQAYTIGMQRMWDKLWRPGTGYERMPGRLETMLAQVDPDLPEVVYAAVNSGMNMGEIEGRLFGAARRVNVERAIDDAARTIFPDNQDAAREILRTTGIGEELARRLETAQTPRDVERAFTAVRNRMQDFLDRVAAQELVNVEPEVVQRIQTEGFRAAMPTYTDLQVTIAERWLEHFRNIEEMVSRVANGTPEERNAAWRQIGESESRDWKRTHEFETQVLSGLFQTMDMDMPETHQFITKTKEINQAWRDFYDGYEINPATGERITWGEAQRLGISPVHVKGRNDMFRELFARSRDLDGAAFRREYERVEAEVSAMARITQEREATLQQEADTLFAMAWHRKTGTDPSQVLAWRRNVWDVRQQMMDEMNTFRQQLRNSRMTSDQRRAAWQDFLDRKYRPLIARLTMEEVAGGRQTFGEAGEPAGTPTPGQPTQGGNVPDLGNQPETTPDLGNQIDAARTRQETIDQAAQQREAAQTRAQALLNRDEVLNRMGEAFNLTDEEKTAVGAILDLYAQRWAERNNSTPDEWYATRVRDIQRRQFDPNAQGNLNQANNDLVQLANRYGISTATNKGTPNDVYLLNIIRKYGGEEGQAITRLDDVSLDLAQRAFEARRVEKGLPPVEMSLPAAKGEIQFAEDGRAVIRAFQGADVSTLVHELGHVFRRDFYDIDDAGRLKPTKELDAIAKLVGLENGNEYLALQYGFDGGYLSEADRARYMDAEEKFARAWERYLADESGYKRTLEPTLRGVFEKFTSWILDIYKRLSGSSIDINLDAKITLADGSQYSLRRIFDEMLFDREAVQNYERNRIDQAGLEQLARRSITEGVPLEELTQGLDIRPDEMQWMQEAIPQLERQIQANRNFDELLDERQQQTNYENSPGEGPLYDWYEKPVSESEIPDSLRNEIRSAADYAAKNFPGSEFGSQRITDGEGNIRKTKSSRNKLMEQLNAYYHGAGASSEQWNTQAWVAAFQRIANGTDKGSKIDIAARRFVRDLMLGDADQYKPFNYISNPYMDAIGLEIPANKLNPADWMERYSDRWFEREMALEEAVKELIRTPGDQVQANDLFTEGTALMKELPADFMADMGVPVTRQLELLRMWERGYTVEPIESRYHGNVPVDQVVMLNGETVAYVPTWLELMQQDGSLTLGLDPSDPNVAVYDQRGEVKRVALNNQAEPVLRQQAEGIQVPAALHHNQVADESRRMMVDSMLDGTRMQLIDQMNRQGGSTIPEELVPEVRKWLKGVESNMASTKLATMRYGEQMRDMALLNYNKRTGLDTMLNVAFPYQFWYTRSMMNWAMRMVDRPSWFSMYARVRNLQEKYEKKGIPTRLKGKMRVLAPYLPDWAGGASYFDPFKVIFPFEQFGQPFEQMRMEKSRQAQTTYEILRAQLDNGQITKSEYEEAVAAKDGYVWNKAWAQAAKEIDSEFSSPVGLVNMMMQPAMYLTAPMNILQGTPEKISPLPVTRTASAIESATQGTVLQPVGTAVGALARPERWIRKQFNLNEFGEWGDYYIDRQLANMAAEGLISADEAQQAMIERQGTVFNQATERVRYEMAVKTPGILPLVAATSGGNAGDILTAIGAGLFPQTLLPDGEMKLRGLSDEYSKAWDDYNAGNKNAINLFFEDNPEYQARLALYDEPDERLRQFLISEIWDRYGQLERPNKSKAVDQLGDAFVETFLDKNTRSYDAIDVETLAYWAQQLGGMVPRTEETQPVTDMPLYQQTPLDMYPPELAQGIEAYQNQRDQLFPNWYEQQTAYYNGGEKSADLEKYWAWKREYQKAHPELKEYFDQNSQQSTGGSSSTDATPEIVSQFYQQKDALFPGIDQHSQFYQVYGVETPELQKYWAWKDEQEQGSKELKSYFREQRIANSDYPEAIARAIEDYKDIRDATFPNWREEQDGYYASGKSKAYLADHPNLKKYWDWKNNYRQAHPEIEAYFNQASSVSFGGERDYQEQYQTVNAATIMSWDQALQRQLLGYFFNDEALTSGARKALMREWEKLGKPGGKFEVFLDEILRSQIYGQ